MQIDRPLRRDQGRFRPAIVRQVVLIPQFCAHRPGTVVERQWMQISDWSSIPPSVHVRTDLYKMCPYGPQSHNQRLRFSVLFCVSARKSRYPNDCGPVAPLTRKESAENLKKKKDLGSARKWRWESQLDGSDSCWAAVYRCV